MSPEKRNKRESQSPDPNRMWRTVLLKEKEGAPLTDSQIRSLEIRKSAIDIIVSMEEILRDPEIQDDVLRHADIVATYWQGMVKLQDMGVTEGMHLGEPQEAFHDPLVMAEWFAGQLVGRDIDKLPTARQAIAYIQEHSTKEDQTQVSEDVFSFFIDAKKLTPSFKSVLITHSIINLGYRFLAIDLDNPQQSKAEQL